MTRKREFECPLATTRTQLFMTMRRTSGKAAGGATIPQTYIQVIEFGDKRSGERKRKNTVGHFRRKSVVAFRAFWRIPNCRSTFCTCSAAKSAASLALSETPYSRSHFATFLFRSNASSSNLRFAFLAALFACSLNAFPYSTEIQQSLLHMSFYQVHLPEGHAIHLIHITMGRRGWCTSLESSLPPSAEEEEEFWEVS
jgi:hypothetical protein